MLPGRVRPPRNCGRIPAPDMTGSCMHGDPDCACTGKPSSLAHGNFSYPMSPCLPEVATSSPLKVEVTVEVTPDGLAEQEQIVATASAASDGVCTACT